MIDIPMTTEEILAEYEWLSSFGRTDQQIADQLGMKLDTLYTVLRRHGNAEGERR